MRDYQRKVGNKYILPNAVYHQTLWMIRDYYRLKEEANAILVESPPPPDGLPHGSSSGDEVAAKAERREELIAKIRQIDDALELIPIDYRNGVWCNAMGWDRFPDDADRSTYGRYKSKFIYFVAKNAGLI